MIATRVKPLSKRAARISLFTAAMRTLRDSNHGRQG
jgi:hypothetical protein